MIPPLNRKPCGGVSIILSLPSMQYADHCRLSSRSCSFDSAPCNPTPVRRHLDRVPRYMYMYAAGSSSRTRTHCVDIWCRAERPFHLALAPRCPGTQEDVEFHNMWTCGCRNGEGGGVETFAGCGMRGGGVGCGWFVIRGK